VDTNPTNPLKLNKSQQNRLVRNLHEYTLVMTEKVKTKQKYQLLGFDSQEEMYFNDWCLELGLNFKYKPKTFLLTEPVKLIQQKQRSLCSVHLLNNLEYTADFVIYKPFPAFVGTISFMVDISVSPIQQHPKTPLFICCGDDLIVDTKAVNFMGSGRSSDIRFPIIQKVLYRDYGVYVNSVIPDKLFERTFYPESYFYTDKGAERCKKIKNEMVPLSKILKKFNNIN
jgi:hypothetical protein